MGLRRRVHHPAHDRQLRPRARASLERGGACPGLHAPTLALPGERSLPIHRRGLLYFRRPLDRGLAHRVLASCLSTPGGWRRAPCPWGRNAPRLSSVHRLLDVGTRESADPSPDRPVPDRLHGRGPREPRKAASAVRNRGAGDAESDRLDLAARPTASARGPPMPACRCGQGSAGGVPSLSPVGDLRGLLLRIAHPEQRAGKAEHGD